MKFDSIAWEKITGNLEPHDPATPLGCPCCATVPVQRAVEPGGPCPRAYLQCPSCGTSTGFHDTPEEALAAWNRRAAPPLPQMEGMFPVVLFFSSLEAADEFSDMVRAGAPNAAELCAS